MCIVCQKGGKLTASFNPIARQSETIDAAALVAFSIVDDFAAPTAFSKLTTAFPIDGVGDLKPPLPTDPLLVTTDNVPDEPDGPGGNPTLIVGDPHTISTIDTNGDRDFYEVTLVAGETYEIGMYGFTGGPGLTPLPDAYIELYDANGNFIVSGDGGAATPANDVNSGFDVLLTFEAVTGGTYYVNAQAFDNAPEDGTTGEGVGDYEVFVQEAAEGGYRPYYDVDSPLYALDWGTQTNKVNQSVRNPDGDEGTRDTGNAEGAPIYGTDFQYDSDGDGINETYDINTLAASQGKDVEGKNVITIYYAKEGEIVASNDPTQPGLPPATITARAVQDFEVLAVNTALAEFEKVADVIYLEVDSKDDADFVYTSYIGTPGPGVSLLGSMSPPDESDEGLAQFNSGDERWNATNLAQGGFSFVTLIHEFGHGHGMAHPHDNGGRSGIMNGVVADGPAFDYTTGDFALNQAVFTMMSYQDGWPESPHGNAETDAGYGYLGGLMAFDIATIQDKYGVNEEWATGNDTYQLKDENAAGTFYYSIWDGGGTDEIVYSGDRASLVDLRAATLEYEIGGGGRVSYADGIFGGFTVANGVVIENASTGEGADTLIGNSADNRLTGNGGRDRLKGGGGDDVLKGNADRDVLAGGRGDDQLVGGLDRDKLFGNGGADSYRFNDGDTGATRVLADKISGFSQAQGDLIDLSLIDADSVIKGEQNFSFIGSEAFSGTAGELRYDSDADKGRTFIEADTDGDGAADMIIKIFGAVELVQTDFVI